MGPRLRAFSTSRTARVPTTETRDGKQNSIGENMRKLASLQQLKSETSLLRLEAALETGNNLLREIKSAFADATSVVEVAKWVKQADDLQARSRKQRTVVGVVGSTGAGKSSMINAVLDEENLVPTNGMRACTATITEIQYSETEDEQAAYRADIHFIHANDWVGELQALREDLKAPGDDLKAPGDDIVGAEQLGSEPRAAVAYDKIRSVYPRLSKEDITNLEFSPEALAQQAPVKDVLGTVKVITAPTQVCHAGEWDAGEEIRGQRPEYLFGSTRMYLVLFLFSPPHLKSSVIDGILALPSTYPY